MNHRNYNEKQVKRMRQIIGFTRKNHEIVEEESGRKTIKINGRAMNHGITGHNPDWSFWGLKYCLHDV